MKTEATKEIMASCIFFVEKISVWSKIMWVTRLAMRLRGEDNSIEEMISLSKVSDKLLNKLVYDYMFRCVIKLCLGGCASPDVCVAQDDRFASGDVAKR